VTPNDKISALIRTYVPYAIGGALAWLLTVTAIDLSGEFEAALVALVLVVVQNVYYLVVRLGETRIPGLGILLGLPKAPEYDNVSNLWASVVRTGIPTIVGALIGLVVVWLGNIPADVSTGLTVTIIAVAQAAYYALAALVIEKWPRATALLGDIKAPGYMPRHLAD
jgi:hypothetical protein